MKTTLKIIFLALFLSVAGLTILTFFVPALSYAQVQISASIPAGNYANTTTSAPGGFVANFYQYALMVGGILAFGVVVYGGVRYMISAGNPSGQSDAKEWIQAAIMGILLLAGAYFILKVINPNLVNLTLPTLTQINIQSGSGGTGGGGGTSSGGTCANCTTLPNCVVKAGVTNCGGAPAMEKALTCMGLKDPGYVVNEGYPPIGGHSDPGHNTGCAVDLHIPDQCGKNGCSASQCKEISALEVAAENCGVAKPLDEYSGCSDSKQYSHTSGGNLHIDAPKGSGGC
jgi:hypothetical protein